MTVGRRCRVIHSGESMPEIISVYSYVGGGGGGVLTSSVNELYLSVGFIRGFFLLPSVASLVPLHSPLLIATCSCSAASLTPYDPFFFVTDKNSRDTRNPHFPNWRIQPFGPPELFMSPLKSQPATSRDGIKMSRVFVEIFAVRETCTR